jgi:ABC-type dipeptide/oligopeptide/nickel transport system permease subunit
VRVALGSARVAVGWRGGCGIAGVTGLVIGLLCAWYRPVDRILMRVCDGLFAFPSLLLAIAIVGVLGKKSATWCWRCHWSTMVDCPRDSRRGDGHQREKLYRSAAYKGRQPRALSG